MAYPATPKTWVSGDVLTAAQLNAELRNALLGAFPLGPPDVAWTSYTPTLVQPGAVTKTVTYAKYTKVGRMVNLVCKLVVTGTGTAANAIVVGLPLTAAASGLVIGAGVIYDASANTMYKGIVNMSSTTALQFYWCGDTTIGSIGTVGMTAALAVGDEIQFSITYEAAT